MAREIVAIAPALPGYYAVYADAESPDGKPYSTSPIVLWVLVRDEATGAVSVSAFDESGLSDEFTMGPCDEFDNFLGFASERRLSEEADYFAQEARRYLERQARRRQRKGGAKAA